MKARDLGLKGFVRNQPDGSVYAEAEGNVELLKAFEKWCWEGSPLSDVKSVITEKGAIVGFSDFDIQR